jgi:hypothetical protein
VPPEMQQHLGGALPIKGLRDRLGATAKPGTAASSARPSSRRASSWHGLGWLPGWRAARRVHAPGPRTARQGGSTLAAILGCRTTQNGCLRGVWGARGPCGWSESARLQPARMARAPATLHGTARWSQLTTAPQPSGPRATSHEHSGAHNHGGVSQPSSDFLGLGGRSH